MSDSKFKYCKLRHKLRLKRITSCLLLKDEFNCYLEIYDDIFQHFIIKNYMVYIKIITLILIINMKCRISVLTLHIN